MGQIAQDTFTRTGQSGWGTSTDGQTWNQIDGTDTLSIGANEGKATGSVNTNSMQLGSKTAKDVEGLVRTAPGGTNVKTGIELRLADLNNFYLARLNGQNNTIELCKMISGTLTVLNSAAFTITANSFYWIRFRVQGTTLSGKIWADGSGEPGSWTVTTTDSSISAAGGFGLYSIANATGTVNKFDSFTVTNLQDTLDIPMRVRFAPPSNTKDIMMRARFAGLAVKDVPMRVAFRPPGTNMTKDINMRARFAGLSQRDIMMRVCFEEAITALPALVANIITVQVGSTSYTVLEGSFGYSETIDGRSTCKFIIRDDTGTVHFRYRQPVKVTHSVRGTVFRGFINTSLENNVYPNTMNTLQVTCIDEHWIPDKRAYEGNEFENQNAGDIASTLVSILAADGVTASYVIDRDTSASDFAQGTLSGVVAASNLGGSPSGDGDLELAPAGQTVTIRENTQQAFALGLLNKVIATLAGTLQLASAPAIKLVGTCAANIGSNLYTYVEIWTGGSVSFASGDYLTYDVWVSSTSPTITGGVDVVCTDGTTLRDSPGLDQNQIPVHPKTDLSGFANDQWYSRVIGIPSQLVGKTAGYVCVAQEGDASGTYTIYVRHIKLFNSSNVIKAIFFENVLNMNQQLQNVGYYNVSTSLITAYEQSGNRLSSNYDLSPAGIARASLISWIESIPTQPTGGATSSVLPILVETSWDAGASWQQMTNNTPIASLLAGTSLAGKVLLIRETLTINGPSPEVTPVLSAVQATIQPSYACNKTDVRESNTLNVALNQGTLTNISTVPGIGNQISGWKRDWDNGSLAQQTLYGDQANPPAQSIWYKALQLRVSPGFDARARLDFAGQWQDFVAEFDTQFPDTDSANYGIVYRTTGWQNNNDTYAYSAFLSNTGVAIGKGTNNSVGAGSFTSLGSASVSLIAGNWYHVKLVVAGTSHKLYVNDVLYVSITDATYTAAGYLGLRHYYNGGASRHSGYFDNFGIMTSAFVGTRVHQPLNLSACQIVTNSIIQWNVLVPPNCTFLVESSLDGGAHYTACTNGAAIPGLSPGINVSGIFLLIRETYSTNNANVTPTLTGITTYVVGQFQSVGQRISVPLSLSPIGRVGSSLVAWNANLANDKTTLGVDVSPDGINWTDVSDSNGSTIPFINSQSDPYSENFSADQSSLYTKSFVAGGGGGIPQLSYVIRAFGSTLILTRSTDATWTVDTLNKRLIATGGIHALFSPAGQTLGDGEIFFDTDYADAGGCMWHLSSDLGTCYELAIFDSNAPTKPNRMRLYKVTGGQYTQLGQSVALNFTRGVPARFKVIQVGGNITITVSYPITTDSGAVVGGNTQTLSYTDPSPLSAGGVALRSDSGTQHYSFLQFTQYGDDVTNKSLYTRVRLASSDPLYTPQVQDVTVSVHGSTIGDGALIPATTYSTLSGSTNTIAQDLDDLAKQSNYWQRILDGQFYFQPTTGILAPFVITGNDMLVNTKIQVKYNSDLYRNEQIIIGGTDVEARSDIRIADGFRTGFDTNDPIDSISTIFINGQSVSFGLQGVDTGKNWYYQQGQKGIIQDGSATPLTAGTQVIIDYDGQIQVIAKARNNGQIALLAAIDQTSGVVTVTEKADGLNSAAAQQLALSRLQQYSIFDSIDLIFTTCRPGLRIGQLLTIFLSQHALANLTFLITQVDYREAIATVNGLQTLLEYFTIACTSGPIVGNWLRLYA